MDKEKIYELLSAYFSNNISEEDKRSIEKWISESEQNKEFYELSKTVWENSGRTSSTFQTDVDAAWNKVRSNIHVDEKVISINRNRIKYYRIAAAIALVLSIGILIRFYFVANSAVEYVTADEQQEIILPDGSHIWLNKHSTLSYDKSNFNTLARNVSLNGEAYFEVKRDVTKPFVIESNETFTRVLGTTFNIRAFDKNEVEVSVNSGKVEVSYHENKIILTKGERGLVNRKNNEVKELSNEANYLAWKTKKLEFNNEPFRSVIPAIEKYFIIDIEADTAILNCHFTGTFNDPRINEVLETITLSTGLNYTLVKDKVMIEGKACK
jgi:transmembrane sensor